MIRNTLERIGTEYSKAIKQNFSGHPLAENIRRNAPNAIKNALGSMSNGLHIKASCGQGKWATVPWIAIFNPLVTTTATRGYYVVYLFNVHNNDVYLSLNQGATAVFDEFNTNKGSTILADRASLICSRMRDRTSTYNVDSIDLGGTGMLPRGYEAGHAFGTQYDINNLPENDVLRTDLQRICRDYYSLIYRGGISPSYEVGAEDSPSDKKQTIEEIRQYKVHKLIERNGNTSRKVKKIQGYRCRACHMSFVEKYGELGKEFIEAHHLIPLANLEKGVATEYDIEKDFAVLCANCHRMIHQLDDSSNLQELKEIINSQQKVTNATKSI
nr:DUF3578 domain-containing protein [Pseudodesulfovibrio sp.]